VVRVLADAVADVAARQLVTPSEFARQALLDKLATMGAVRGVRSCNVA
jgi:hypothetical protein